MDRWLGHPVAYILTAAILLTIFGWTFFTNPDRVAPTKDPAYYTWRTEALLTETPETLLEIEGPRYEGGGGMYSGGYRVSAPVLGGLLRRVADVAPLSTTAFLMVGVPVLTALLLGAFAFQYRRDPLIFHGVALGAASLYLTPPFVGYLDNLLALFFLAGGLLFLRDAPNSWPARIGLGFFLLMVGFTHPTTLVIFFLTLGAMAFVRFIYRKFDLRSVIRDDGPAVAVAFLSIVVSYVLWKVGIWGRSASLGDAALLPPYESSFFVDRLVLWVEAMRPAINGPLFLLGAAALVMSGRKAAEDELSRVSIVWLAPLVGIFGFLAGKSYPYYRFFNTTLAWVLLIGIGMWLAARFFIGLARRGGVYNLAWLGVVALVLVIATNFRSGLDVSGWNNAQGGWLSASEREDLDQLRSALARAGEPRPVVFVVDTEDTSPRSYGYTKLSGNTSRYGLPAGWIDEAYLYLGSVENYLLNQPTEVGEATYDEVSRATLEDAREGVEASGQEPITVVAAAFNETGSNTEYVESSSAPDLSGESEVWIVNDEGITQETAGATEGDIPGDAFSVLESPDDDPGFLHVLRVIFGLLLLMLPGSLAARWLLRDASFPEWLAAAPALGISIVTLVTIAVLSVTRNSLGSGAAWVALGIAIVGTAVLAWRSNPPPPDPAS
jgi:hypothetical protein